MTPYWAVSVNPCSISPSISPFHQPTLCTLHVQQGEKKRSEHLWRLISVPPSHPASGPCQAPLSTPPVNIYAVHLLFSHYLRGENVTTLSYDNYRAVFLPPLTDSKEPRVNILISFVLSVLFYSRSCSSSSPSSCSSRPGSPTSVRPLAVRFH